MGRLSAQNWPAPTGSSQVDVPTVTPYSLRSVTVTASAVVPPLRTTQSALSCVPEPKMVGLDIWAAWDQLLSARTPAQAVAATSAFMETSVWWRMVLNMRGPGSRAYLSSSATNTSWSWVVALLSSNVPRSLATVLAVTEQAA